MNENKIKECAYVTQMLDKTAHAVYQEMFGDWKKYYFCRLGFTTPDEAVFCYQTKQLLPKEYMEGVPDAKPNSLFKALLHGRWDDAMRIIRKAQFMNVKEWAAQYEIDYTLAQKEIHTLWILTTGESKCYPIPVWISEYYADWANGDSLAHGYTKRYAKYRGMKNGSFFDGIFEACYLVLMTLVVSSKNQAELEAVFGKFAASGKWLSMLGIEWGDYSIQDVTEPDRIYYMNSLYDIELS